MLFAMGREKCRTGLSRPGPGAGCSMLPPSLRAGLAAHSLVSSTATGWGSVVIA